MSGNKEFFENRNEDLAGLYNLTKDDLDEQDIYPIQSELKSLERRFKEARSVGEGAMKKVLSVKDLPSGRRVAKAGLHDTSDKKVVEAFLREARLTASLQHPNIIRIYDIGMDGDEPWFSMELIEGQSLQEKIEYYRISQKEWPLFQRLEVFNKICDAVAYGHSKNTLHLDIKPDNIRLGLYGEVILCDWGLGYYIHGEVDEVDYLEMPHLKNDNTLHGYIRGTPGYLAPERMVGGKSVSSDIYSLGALLYTLMTYEAPVKGKDLEDVLKKTKLGQITEPRIKIPVSIRSIYSKSLNVNECDRYKNVQALQADLTKYRNGFATKAEQAGFFKQLYLFCNRNKSICGLVVVFTVLIAVTIYNYVEDIKQSQKRYRAEKEKAENALSLYKKGEEEKKNINKDFTELLVSSTKMTTDHFDMDKSLFLINLAVEKDSENSEAWLRKGYIHFIRHEFMKAYEAFERSNNTGADIKAIKDISQENAATKGLLNPEKTVLLLNRIPKSLEKMRMYFLNYDAEHRQSLNDHSVIVKNMLEYRNAISILNFKFDVKEKSLDLANNISLAHCDGLPMESLKSTCLLKTLNLKKLNLANTSINNLLHLQGLDSLEELNLEKTLVLDLRPLREMKTLKKVTLSQSQRKLAKGSWPFKIVYSKDSGNNSMVEIQIQKIIKQYSELDQDKSGALSVNELSKVIPKDSVLYFSKVLNVDKDGDGVFSKSELEALLSIEGSNKKILESLLKFLNRNFVKFDVNKDGGISAAELSKSKRFGDGNKGVFRNLDKDNNGLLSKQELEDGLTK